MKPSLNLLLMAVILFSFCLCSEKAKLPPIANDDSGKPGIESLLKPGGILSRLNYPKLLNSRYRDKKYGYIWFDQNDGDKHLLDAMMLLDCVVQYGLDPGGYHPKELTYDNVSKIQAGGETSHKLKDSIDILLTDAIFTLIADLRFGRANPYISKQALDNVASAGSQIDSVLLKALGSDLTATIRDAQPLNPDYRELQDYLRLAAGQYAGDCYEIPEDTLKLVALNLERYRWENTSASVLVAINIPSFRLKFTDGRQMFESKVIVGKHESPTPTLHSEIGSMRTAADSIITARYFLNNLIPRSLLDPAYLRRHNFVIYSQNGEIVSPSVSNLKKIQAYPEKYLVRMPGGCSDSLTRIIFDFDNPYQINIHDTPDKSRFSYDMRALSGGCIWVDNPRELAARLLRVRGENRDEYFRLSQAMDTRQKYFYSFGDPIAVAIRYITCDVRDGQLIVYRDLYGLDKALKDKLFPTVDLVPDPR